MNLRYLVASGISFMSILNDMGYVVATGFHVALHRYLSSKSFLSSFMNDRGLDRQ